jgi:hypothetical protein
LGRERLSHPNLYHRSHECSFRLSAEQFHSIVQHDFGYAHNCVTLSHIGKLADLDDIGRNVLAFDCHLVRQPGDGRAMGSHGCREDLKVYVIFERAQGLPTTLR